VIIVIAALFGTSWISTEEKIPWLQVNSSFYRTNNFSVSYVIKSSNASLWIICTRLGKDLLYCIVVGSINWPHHMMKTTIYNNDNKVMRININHMVPMDLAHFC
jgi:hypothetical protein